MQQGKPVTVNDIIQADPRVKELKKNFQGFQQKKNEHVFAISHVEAEIIALMGAFEYLNNFTETDEERVKLLDKFLPLIEKKDNLISLMVEQDINMKNTEEEFKSVADSIVKELQDMKKKYESRFESTESCPESSPVCSCGKGCACSTKEHQICDHCQGICDSIPRKDREV